MCLVTDDCIDLLFMGALLIESVNVKLKCSAGGNELPALNGKEGSSSLPATP